MRFSYRSFWRNTVRPVAVIFIAVFSFRSTVADWNDVPSQSMEPTILTGDRIVVNRLAFDLKVPFLGWRLAPTGAPQRGDIIVFFHPVTGERMVKRVVGVPGDVIAMRDNALWINGAAVRRARISVPDASELSDPGPLVAERELLGASPHAVLYQPRRAARRSFTSVAVPPDHYFVMGDNRDNSRDSRYFGMVPRSAIAGRAFGVAFSLDSRRPLRVRWGRALHGVN
jgi:signal peptidase I